MYCKRLPARARERSRARMEFIAKSGKHSSNSRTENFKGDNI